MFLLTQLAVMLHNTDYACFDCQHRISFPADALNASKFNKPTLGVRKAASLEQLRSAAHQALLLQGPFDLRP
jgi:hypothetical protein